MQLPILGTIPTKFPINFASGASSRSEDTSKPFAGPQAKETAPSRPTQGAYKTAPVTAETQSFLLALQEGAAREASTKSININGLSIITSGHSVDARDGVSLIQTLSAADTKAMMSTFAAIADQAENGGGAQTQEGSQSGNSMIKIDMQGGMVEIASKALGAPPDGATSAYMNEDFFHSNGVWSNGNPIEKSNSDAAIKADRRVRLETLMNAVDAERQLRAEYGQDVKLVYSHTDESYIMLTPDDAKYDTMKSAESSVQDVMNEVQRGYIEKGTVADILQRYGYHI